MPGTNMILPEIAAVQRAVRATKRANETNMRQREEALVDQILAIEAAQIKASQQLDREAKIADGIRKDNN